MARCPSQGDTCPSQGDTCPSQGRLSSCPSQDYFPKAMLLVLARGSSMVTGPRQGYLSKGGCPRQFVNLAKSRPIVNLTKTRLLAQGILSKAACQLVQIKAACQG